MRLALLVAAASVLAQTPARPLWVDVTGTALGQTRYWTNKVEIASQEVDPHGRVNQDLTGLGHAA